MSEKFWIVFRHSDISDADDICTSNEGAMVKAIGLAQKTGSAHYVLELVGVANVVYTEINEEKK